MINNEDSKRVDTMTLICIQKRKMNACSGGVEGCDGQLHSPLYESFRRFPAKKNQ